MADVELSIDKGELIINTSSNNPPPFISLADKILNLIFKLFTSMSTSSFWYGFDPLDDTRGEWLCHLNPPPGNPDVVQSSTINVRAHHPHYDRINDSDRGLWCRKCLAFGFDREASLTSPFILGTASASITVV
jgi:hypothetical protein